MATIVNTETVGERIKRVRLEKRLTQRGISTTSVSYAYISRIEAGARTPSLSALREIAEQLDVTALYLETGENGYCGHCQRG